MIIFLTILRVEVLVVMLSLFTFRTSANSAYEDSGLFDEDYDTPSFNNARCPWIRHKLKNGRVKIRSRGRIAKFVCEPGYDLAGKRFATCVRGQWNNPIPVCVTRGCHKPLDVKNSRITKLYRGAVINYDCLPGYTLDGGASIYCDGRRWSSQSPTCMVATSDPHTTCDFEDPDLCGWSQDPTHDFDWKRNQLYTPSGHMGTGPSFDHTFGAGKGGSYMYLEASAPRKLDDKARLYSPVYPPDYSGGCFTFWYHMFGESTGGLELYIKPESQVFGEQGSAWKIDSDQGNRWFRGEVSVPNITENFQIIIEGIRGSNYLGDSAVDDVSLETVDCQSVRNFTDNTSDLLSYSCRGRCREVVNSSFCGCGDECVTEGSCCDDFSSICTKIVDNDGNTSEEITTPPLKFKTVSQITEDEKVSTTNAIISTTISEYRGDATQELKTSTETQSTQLNEHTTDLLSTYKPSTTFQTLSTTRTYSSTKNTQPTSIFTSQSTSTEGSSTLATQSETILMEPITNPFTLSFKTTLMQLQTTSLTPLISSTTTKPSTTRENQRTSNLPLLSGTSFSTSEPSSTTLSSTLPYVFQTTKRYNLRPRYRTSTVIPELSSISNTYEMPSYSTVKYYRKPFTSGPPYRASTTSPMWWSTIPSSRTSERDVIYFDLPPEFPSPTVKQKVPVTFAETTLRPTHVYPVVTQTPQIRTSQKPSTESQIIFTTSSSFSTSNHSYASKHSHSASMSSSSVATATTLTILAICSVVAIWFFIKKQRMAKQSKLADDSEMRFLSENEVAEYNDSAALDRVGYSS